MEIPSENGIKAPYYVEVLDDEPVEVANKFTGQTVMLSPLAVAVYDTIQGAEMILSQGATNKKEYDKLVRYMQDGLSWFRKHFGKEYMILLD